MRFRQTNSLTNWESNTSVDTGDENTAVPAIFPFSVHSQMLGKLHRGKSFADQSTGEIDKGSNLDLQTPSFIKLISSAPLTENIGFYFDAHLIPGENQGTFSLNEAWVRYRWENEFIAAITAGQIPNSDVIVDQDTRLSIKDYLIYEQSGLLLDRGLRFDIDIREFLLSAGVSNGNDSKNVTNVNSTGIGRNDQIYDNNNRKTLYGYFAKRFNNFRTGLFWQVNQQFAPADLLAQSLSDRLIFQYSSGFDIQAFPSGKVNWMAQFMWNKWNEFLEPQKNISWFGGFVAINYAATDTLAYSLLYNYTDAGDFRNTGSIYEGLASNTITTSISYYFRSNVRGIVEITMDFLPQENDADFVGHESKEDNLSIGIDINY